MKKFTLILLSVLMIVTLVACGDKECKHTYDNASDATVNIIDSTINSKNIGVYGGGTLNISGDTSITGTNLTGVYRTGGALTISSGITVEGNTLTELLATDTAAYWGVVDDKDTMLTVVDDAATGITDKGDITIRAICDHKDVKLDYITTETTHTPVCSVCNWTGEATDHTGGTATCQTQAVCEVCEESYGDLNPDNHISVDIEMGLCSCGYQFEARIGDTPYVTFEDAFLAASTGDTVVAYAGRSAGNLVIPKGVIFNGGEYEFSTMTENRGEIIGGKYTGNTINYGKITGGLFEGNRFVVSNYGEITGGTFNIYVEHYSGKLTGGIFNIFVAAHANIDGGHFTESSGIDFYGDMDTGIFYVVINGGVFDCDFTAFTNIYGGEFNGEVINCSEIFGGVFNGEVINSRGKIFDGEFNGKVTNGVLAENGMLDRNGFILGGIFNSEILNYSHIYNLVDDDYTFILGESFVMTYVNGRITCEEHIKASDATCTAQAICRICGSYGELLDHSWTDATCETPKTCSVCNLTEGEALGHDYADATCETPKTCKICNATEGEALGHDYADATCETPKTCKNCGATEGEALGHDFADATTEAPKTCKNCGETEGEPLSKPEEPNWLIKIINAILDFLKKLFVIK